MAEIDGHKVKTGHTALLMRFSALGDVAMTVPPVIDACVANRTDRFVFLTRPLPAKTYADENRLPPNLEVRPVDLREYSGIGGLWRLSGELWREFRPDTVVDLHDVIRSRLISLFLRIRSFRRVRVARIRKGRSEKRAATRAGNKVRRQLPSGDSRYRDTLARAGFDAPESFVGFWQEDRRRRLADPGRAPRVAVAPFAAHAGKEWPVEFVEAVLGHFAAISGCEIFVFGGGRREAAMIAGWAIRWPGIVTDMCEARLGLRREMEIMSLCDVMLSMDSANMHLASLVSLPVVSVWGATHPVTGFMGWRQDAADVVQVDMECRPCSVFGNRPCRLDGAPADRPCLRGVTPDAVIAAMERHLPPRHSDKEQN